MDSEKTQISGAEYYGMGTRYAGACLSKLRLPADMLEAIAEWMKAPKNFFVFSGSVGIGKTYLCAAIVNFWFGKGIEMRFFTMEQLVSAIHSVIAFGHDTGRELERLAEAQLFILDDLGATQDTEHRASKIFQLIDMRCNSMKPTIVTTNLSESEVEAVYGSRARSRLFSKDNLVIKLVAGDLRADEPPG